MKRARQRLVAGIAGLAIAMTAAPASATITMADSETGQQLGTFDQAQCRVNKKAGPSKIRFSAFSLPKGDTYTLAVFISNFDWHGFGGEYPLLFGDGHTIAQVFAPNTNFSNEYPIPGTPPDTVGVGGIKLSNNGKRISVGAFGLPNESFTAGVMVSGAAKCKYPKRR